jgi:hypothetical protein
MKLPITGFGNQGRFVAKKNPGDPVCTAVVAGMFPV